MTHRLQIQISGEQVETICHLPPEVKRKVRSALDEIAAKPSVGKELIEDLSGFWSYKLGKLRIIYRIEGSSIRVMAVGPRVSIYEKLVLELKRHAQNNPK